MKKGLLALSLLHIWGIDAFFFQKPNRRLYKLEKKGGPSQVIKSENIHKKKPSICPKMGKKRILQKRVGGKIPEEFSSRTLSLIHLILGADPRDAYIHRGLSAAVGPPLRHITCSIQRRNACWNILRERRRQSIHERILPRDEQGDA